MQQKHITVSKEFNASREKLWEIFTTPEKIEKWWGPDNITEAKVKMDLKVGGQYSLYMASGEQFSMWVSGEYKEITPPEKLVYTQYVSDEDGKALKPSEYGMPGDEVDVSTITITFEEQDGKTTVTLDHLLAGDDKSLEGAKWGWSASMEKIAKILE